MYTIDGNMRMTISIFTIVLGLIVMVFMGVSIIGFIGHTNHQTCPISTLYGNNCPPTDNIVAQISHHVSGVQSLAQALITPWTNVLLLLLFVAILLLFSVIVLRVGYNQSSELLGIQKRLSISIPNPILKWIALHNKRSPDLYLKRVVV